MKKTNKCINWQELGDHALGVHGISRFCAVILSQRIVCAKTSLHLNGMT